MKRQRRVSVVIPAMDDTVIGLGSPGSSAERTAEIVVQQRELKTVDVEPASIQFDDDVTSAAYQITLNGLSEGVAGYQRVGSKVDLESIRYNMFFHFTDQRSGSTTYNPQNSAFRLILVWDKQPSGTMAFNEVFGGIESDGTAYSAPYCYLAPGNETRYRVLRDTIHTFPTVTAPVGSGAQSVKQDVIISEYVSLKGLSTRYSESDDLPSSIRQGRLIFFFISSPLPAAGTQAMWLLGPSRSNIRIRFRDAA